MSDIINIESEFAEAMASDGFSPPEIIADGKIHRFDGLEDKRGKKNAWYVLYADGIGGGAYGDWKLNISTTWSGKPDQAFTAEEKAQWRARQAELRKSTEEERARVAEVASVAVAKHWETSAPVRADHPYLERKAIKPYGAKQLGEQIVIPLRDADGVLHSAQYITPDGGKRFKSGGRIAGCYATVSHGVKPGADAPLLVCEGWATACSLHDATGFPVAAAMSAGNLMAVSSALRGKFPDVTMIICADDDAHTEGNPGVAKAREAAHANGAYLAVPQFGEERSEGMTDFNDLMHSAGLDAVRNTVMESMVDRSETATPTTSRWPAPQPLRPETTPMDYPADSLPPCIRAAVDEVVGFVQAPLPLVASSAIGALSLAIQAHVDVKRAERLVGPTGLFLLTVADSGERKSTCDGFFARAIRDYEAEQAEIYKPIVKDHLADMAAWEAKHGGLREKIKADAKSRKSTIALEEDLRDLENNRPEPPKVPRLIFSDVTPEALAHALGKNWPSGGVVSAEAGIVFGSHGMGSDSVMRNLATLNQLWDGNTLTIDRRTSESFSVRGARLTVALQVQEPTIRTFFEKSGALARGTGFLARFLMSWPRSTQGYRPFTEAPEHWPHMATFNKRLSEILRQPLPLEEDGSLAPLLLSLSPEAKSAWVAFHDEVELQLRAGGELHDVRDVASKSADNAARLSALFHVFSGSTGPISVEAFDSASSIVAWHLSESKRFFSELTLPDDLAEASRLDSWLLEHCRKEHVDNVPKRHVQQFGPLRKADPLSAALRVLEDMDRVKTEKIGKQIVIYINPALLQGDEQ